MINKYIPTFVYKTVYDIDFNKLYANGKRVILTDLDNTLLQYKDSKPTKDLICFIDNLKMLGFKIFIITNNHKNRVEQISKELGIDGFLHQAFKPFKYRINWFIKSKSLIKEQIVFIGDQILTDIKSSNSVGVDSILVKTIDSKSQKWYTKLNRKRDAKIISKIAEIDSDKAALITALERS